MASSSALCQGQLIGSRDEGPADLAPFGSADRDVLEIGVVAGKPTGHGTGLIEVRVNTVGGWPDVLGKGIDVGVLQLAELAVAEDERDDGMPVLELA